MQKEQRTFTREFCCDPEVDALRVELEYQHKRLDEARDIALARKTKEMHHESG